VPGMGLHFFFHFCNLKRKAVAIKDTLFYETSVFMKKCKIYICNIREEEAAKGVQN
jgi:hypothetical protein